MDKRIASDFLTPLRKKLSRHGNTLSFSRKDSSPAQGRTAMKYAFGATLFVLSIPMAESPAAQMREGYCRRPTARSVAAR